MITIVDDASASFVDAASATHDSKQKLLRPAKRDEKAKADTDVKAQPGAMAEAVKVADTKKPESGKKTD